MSAKFLLILIPILTLTAVGGSAFFLHGKYEHLHGALSTRMATFAEANAQLLASALWTMDKAAVEALLRAMALNPELRCIAVSDDLSHTSFVWPPSPEPAAECPLAGSGEAASAAPSRSRAGMSAP